MDGTITAARTSNHPSLDAPGAGLADSVATPASSTAEKACSVRPLAPTISAADTVTRAALLDRYSLTALVSTPGASRQTTVKSSNLRTSARTNTPGAISCSSIGTP
ncbi:MAG: hypothetical protein KDI56_04850, partial [Xanthomonadales bacterium]|nr:hypothetical protein [Xanthomonadales bacterium]